MTFLAATAAYTLSVYSNEGFDKSKPTITVYWGKGLPEAGKNDWMCYTDPVYNDDEAQSLKLVKSLQTTGGKLR